jgi:hypothetical protein
MKSILPTVGCYYFRLPRLSAPSIWPRQNKDLEMRLREKARAGSVLTGNRLNPEKNGAAYVAAPRAAKLLGYSDWSPSLS